MINDRMLETAEIFAMQKFPFCIRALSQKPTDLYGAWKQGRVGGFLPNRKNTKLNTKMACISAAAAAGQAKKFARADIKDNKRGRNATAASAQSRPGTESGAGASDSPLSDGGRQAQVLKFVI